MQCTWEDQHSQGRSSSRQYAAHKDTSPISLSKANNAAHNSRSSSSRDGGARLSDLSRPKGGLDLSSLRTLRMGTRERPAKFPLGRI